MKPKKPKLDAEFWRQDAENRRRMAERIAYHEARAEFERNWAAKQARLREA
ncbi:MAG TPA: hypothetical protein VF101_03300 [Gaiellaceae bacterium]